MYSIIIASHGCLADDLMKSMKTLTYAKLKAGAICIEEEDSVSEAEKRLEAMIQEFLQDGDVIVLTDLKLGSPFNLAIKLMKKYPIFHITGMNLPLLINLSISYDTGETTEELVKRVLKEAKDEMIDVSMLKKEVDYENCIGEGGRTANSWKNSE